MTKKQAAAEQAPTKKPAAANERAVTANNGKTAAETPPAAAPKERSKHYIAEKVIEPVIARRNGVELEPVERTLWPKKEYPVVLLYGTEFQALLEDGKAHRVVDVDEEHIHKRGTRSIDEIWAKLTAKPEEKAPRAPRAPREPRAAKASKGSSKSPKGTEFRIRLTPAQRQWAALALNTMADNGMDAELMKAFKIDGDVLVVKDTVDRTALAELRGLLTDRAMTLPGVEEGVNFSAAMNAWNRIDASLRPEGLIDEDGPEGEVGPGGVGESEEATDDNLEPSEDEEDEVANGDEEVEEEVEE